MNTNHSSPRLDVPGAGLPWIELQVARGIFRVNLAMASRPKSAKSIVCEQKSILIAAESVSPHRLSQQVLIKRLPGLEDSSRYWSVLMTLSHLAIVNQAVRTAIDGLLRNEVPRMPASTASVKPQVGVGLEAMREFIDSCNHLVSLHVSDDDLRTRQKYPHPWFGPLDARGWYFFAGFHMRLHRKHILEILKRLPGDDEPSTKMS